MRAPLNRMGPLTGGALLLAACLVAAPAAAQLYGAGRNSGAVTVDEDVLSALGGGAPRPGVGVGYLPAPAAPPRSRINLLPPPKPKAAPAPVPVAATPLPAPLPAPAPAPIPARAPDPVPEPAAAPPVALTPEPAAARPQTPRPDPGPPPPPTEPPAAEPPPAPAVAAVVSPPAALPAAAVPAPAPTAKGVRLLFLPDSADVPTTARPALDGVVKQLQSQPDRRVLITAYAAGTPETASQSRRLSLNRALAVRSVLAESGVSTARVDVRALGSQTGDGPADRVDLDLTTP